jgi:hypothetical protein
MRNSWQDYTVTFTTGASVSGDLIVELSVPGSGTIQADFDNVRLAAMPIALKASTLGTSRISDGNLIITGTGGTPNASYTWLAATNLSAPINWMTNGTGTLDGSGALSNAIPINVSQPARYFWLRLP